MVFGFRSRLEVVVVLIIKRFITSNTAYEHASRVSGSIYTNYGQVWYQLKFRNCDRLVRQYYFWNAICLYCKWKENFMVSVGKIYLLKFLIFVFTVRKLFTWQLMILTKKFYLFLLGTNCGFGWKSKKDIYVHGHHVFGCSFSTSIHSSRISLFWRCWVAATSEIYDFGEHLTLILQLF